MDSKPTLNVHVYQAGLEYEDVETARANGHVFPELVGVNPGLVPDRSTWVQFLEQFEELAIVYVMGGQSQYAIPD